MALSYHLTPPILHSLLSLLYPARLIPAYLPAPSLPWSLQSYLHLFYYQITCFRLYKPQILQSLLIQQSPQRSTTISSIPINHPKMVSVAVAIVKVAPASVLNSDHIDSFPHSSVKSAPLLLSAYHNSDTPTNHPVIHIHNYYKTYFHLSLPYIVNHSNSI